MYEIQREDHRRDSCAGIIIDQQWLVVFYGCTHYILQYIALVNIAYTIQPFSISNEQWIFNDK